MASDGFKPAAGLNATPALQENSLVSMKINIRETGRPHVQASKHMSIHADVVAPWSAGAIGGA